MKGAILLFVCVLMACSAHGITQWLRVYETTDYAGDNDYFGNHIYFSYNVFDSSVYPIANSRRFCYSGKWSFFRQPNFTDHSYTDVGYWGSAHVRCFQTEEDWAVSTYQSFRHLGPNDTSVNAITFYAEEVFLDDETLINQGAASSLHGKYKSFVITGKSGWTIFEGNHFDGASKCLIPTTDDASLHAEQYPDVGFHRIGSVFRGCDFPNIYVEPPTFTNLVKPNLKTAPR